MHECAGAVKEALELAVTPLQQWLWLLSIHCYKQKAEE